MPSRTYLLAFSGDASSWDETRSYLDHHPKITNWMSVMRNVFLFVSEADAKEISDDYRDKVTIEIGRFLIMDTTDSIRHGWLPRMAWDMMRYPDGKE